MTGGVHNFNNSHVAPANYNKPFIPQPATPPHQPVSPQGYHQPAPPNYPGYNRESLASGRSEYTPLELMQPFPPQNHPINQNHLANAQNHEQPNHVTDPTQTQRRRYNSDKLNQTTMKPLPPTPKKTGMWSGVKENFSKLKYNSPYYGIKNSFSNSKFSARLSKAVSMAGNPLDTIRSIPAQIKKDRYRPSGDAAYYRDEAAASSNYEREKRHNNFWEGHP